MDLDDLNSLDHAAAADALRSCCSSAEWAAQMAAARPFKDSIALFMKAEEVWWDLGTADWEEAFRAHRVRPDEYVERFGRPYVVYRNGRSPQDLDQLYRSRLAADSMTELQSSAVEQARVTNRRLRELLGLV